MSQHQNNLIEPSSSSSVTPPPTPQTPPVINGNPVIVSVDVNPVIVPNFDAVLVNDLYDKLRALTTGIKYTDTNWVLLANKAITLVTSKELQLVKHMSLADRVELACHLTLLYLDEETNIPDELLDVVQSTLPSVVKNWVESFQSNKKNHKKAVTAQRKTQKQVAKTAADTVAEDTITPARISELLISRIETMVYRGGFTDFDTFQTEIPAIVVMAITVVDKYSHLSMSEKRELIVQTLATVLADKVPKWFRLTDKQSGRAKLLAASLPALVETTTALVNGDVPDKLDLRDVAPLFRDCILGLFKMCGKRQ